MTTPSGVNLVLNMGLPASSRDIPTILEARGAWEMRLENNAPPSGAWQDYNAYFTHQLPAETGRHWVVAEVRDDAGNVAPAVSGQITLYHAGGYLMPMDILVDHSVFYSVSGVLSSGGFKDLDGNLTIHLHQGSLESYIPLELEEDEYGGFDASALSALLPAVCVNSDDQTYDPGALGGASWEKRFYGLDVLGQDDPQAREIAAIICDRIQAGVVIYDFNLGMPGNSGFPLPNQVLGTFPIRNLQNRKVLLPTYGSIHEHRRRITFEVHNIRKAF